MNGLSLGKRKTFFIQASVLKRIAAFFIDIIIINFVILLPFWVIIAPDTSNIDSFSEMVKVSNNLEYSAPIVIISLIAIIFHLLYFIIFEKKLGQSIGKMFFNLYVVSQTKDLKYWQLIVRSLFFILPNIFRFIDFVAMLFTKDNQRLLEILSKTKVVEKYKL